jgi:hypothetical protein
MAESVDLDTWFSTLRSATDSDAHVDACLDDMHGFIDMKSLDLLDEILVRATQQVDELLIVHIIMFARLLRPMREHLAHYDGFIAAARLSLAGRDRDYVKILGDL